MFPMHDGWGWLWMGGFWILVLLLIVCFVTRFLQSSASRRETPLEILKRRYAQGEIAKEEFEQKKKELES